MSPIVRLGVSLTILSAGAIVAAAVRSTDDRAAGGMCGSGIAGAMAGSARENRLPDDRSMPVVSIPTTSESHP